MRPEVADDWAWADGYGGLVREILADNAGKLVEVRAADEDEDLRRATDLVLTLDTGDVALRIRRENVWQRDLTLRYQRRRGPGDEWRSEYEVAKILAGFARWYLYIWTANPDWILVNLDAVRAARLIELAIDADEIVPNKDGPGGCGITNFIPISLDVLDQAHALIASSIDGTVTKSDKPIRGPYRFRCTCPVPEIGRDGRCNRCKGNPEQKESLVWVGWNNPDPLGTGQPGAGSSRS